MLHIILVILKIIGILLACIVALLLLLALSVLLVPVRYRGRVEKNGDISAMGHIHWLLHIVSGKIFYEEGEVSIKVRIFGIPIRLEAKEDRPPKKKKARRKQKQKKEKEKTGPAENTDHSEEDEIQQEPLNAALPDKHEAEGKSPDMESKSPGAEDKSPGEESKGPGAEDKSPGEESESPDVEEENKQQPKPSGNVKRSRKRKENWFKRLIRAIKNFIPNLKARFRKIKYTILEICGRIRNVKENIGYYRKVLKEAETKAALTAGKGEIWKILKHIRPQKMKGYVHFGLGDPANTGIALGAASIFYSLYRDNIKILPDFEQAVLEGELYLKGRVRMIVLLLSLFRLYRDKNIHMTITRFRSKEV